MTVYRRNPLIMTVMGANPGRRHVRRNPGPAFIVIDSITGRVMYTKRATGMGNEAINSCVQKARQLADRNGRSYIVFLDMSRAQVGGQVSVAWARAMGITEEIHPSTRSNPIGEAILAGATSAIVSRAMQSNPHLEGSPCSVCSGSLSYQGTLGNREHYRCRDCGLDFNTPITRRPRSRGWKRTCGHGEITNQCRLCRGRRVSSDVRPCPHGISGGGARCVACQRLYRRGMPVRSNPAIQRSWDGLKMRQRMAILEFAGIDTSRAVNLSGKSWDRLGDIDPRAQAMVARGWRDSSSTTRETETRRRHETTVRMNPGPRGKRKMTITVEKFAEWVKRQNKPEMWKAFLAKFKGYEKWTHGARARKVTLEWVDTPGVDGLWITYDGGKQPESTYIMPKGSPRKGAWKHPWETMPDIKHDPQAGIVITKLRGQAKITDFYHK